MQEMWDIIIIGGGPAGLTAGIYASRARLDTILLEKLLPGGQMMTTAGVENYPGFPEGITGPELMVNFEKQARRLGLKVETAEVTRLVSEKGRIRVATREKGDFYGRAVIIATGSSPQKLGIPGEKEFLAKGVSYCATCDGPLFRDVEVAVIGGGDTALEEGLFLTKFASKVHIIHRRDQLRGEKILQDRAFANPRVHFILETVAEEICGDEVVKSIKLRNVKTNQESEVELRAVFILVGTVPNTDFLKGLVSLDKGGYIIVNERCQTNIPAIFAAGDVYDKVYRQAITAAGSGCAAALEAAKFIEQVKA